MERRKVRPTCIWKIIHRNRGRGGCCAPPERIFICFLQASEVLAIWEHLNPTSGIEISYNRPSVFEQRVGFQVTCISRGSFFPCISRVGAVDHGLPFIFQFLTPSPSEVALRFLTASSINWPAPQGQNDPRCQVSTLSRSQPGNDASPWETAGVSAPV